MLSVLATLFLGTLPALADPPPGAAAEFSTDFDQHSVDFDTIRSGGPPKDGIPAIDDPKHVPVDRADRWLEDREPVIRVEIGGQARAYPVQILTWHEIVNDTLGQTPVVVTFCPLCNSALAFERTLEGTVLDFGTTGRLRFSNMVMYDRQTESWWQQATGEAIVGEHTGKELEPVPAEMIAWEAFKEQHPGAAVLSRDTGHQRAYGRNPYEGYDDVDSNPFLYDGPDLPDTLPPKTRVLTLEVGSEALAVPWPVLRERHVVNETVGELDVVVFWESGTASALDDKVIAKGRDVGAATAFDRTLGDRTMTFAWKDGAFVDAQTGSTWSLHGTATAGPLQGEELEPVVAVPHFWFSWAAFRPEARVVGD